ncbi:MAG: HEAT repeat domain-containing protein [Phycisphaerae bacterium]|nr:HEAT repeat domain-containing protein [Phycisphaerae bacterium]
MSLSALPDTWGVLLAQPSKAVDAAIAEVLPTLEGMEQAAAIEALVRRGNREALSRAFEALPRLSRDGREAVLRELSAWRSELAARLASGESEARVTALKLIAEARAADLAELAVRALEHSCPKTRGEAIQTLGRLLDDTSTARGHDHSTERVSARRCAVLDALRLALRRWSIHRQSGVIFMALGIPVETMDTIRDLVHRRRAPITIVLQKYLERSDDGRFIRFRLSAVGIDTLSSHAIRGLSRIDDEVSFRGLLGEIDVLGDEAVRKGVRRLRRLPFLTQRVERWARWAEDEVAAGLTLARLMGLSQSERLTIYSTVLDEGDPALRDSLLNALRCERGPEAEALLRRISLRDRGAVGAEAIREWRRRTVGTHATESPSPDGSDPLGAAIRRLIHDVGASPNPTREERDVLRVRWSDSLRLLRARLAGLDPEVRRRALIVAREMGAAEALRDVVYRMCHDGDTAVRAAAVGMLADLSDPTATRIVRSALTDPDARVRAAAVEAAERSDRSEARGLVADRLGDESRRVRANAIKALLPGASARAAAELIDMLLHPSPGWRRSGLWVVGRLGLQSQRGRLGQLAQSDEDPAVRRSAGDILERWQAMGTSQGEFSKSGEAASASMVTMEKARS